jgi:hypothetical protein
MAFYPWVVIAHVVFVIIAFGAHGVSAFAMFRVRSDTDRNRLAALLDLSTLSLVVAGVGLLLAVLLGIVAAIMGDHFSRLWPWAAIVTVIVITGLMTPLAANPMNGVRKALGIATRDDKKGGPPPSPASDTDLAAARARLRPELVAVLGVAAIVILVWLMEMKPF